LTFILADRQRRSGHRTRNAVGARIVIGARCGTCLFCWPGPRRSTGFQDVQDSVQLRDTIRRSRRLGQCSAPKLNLDSGGKCTGCYQRVLPKCSLSFQVPRLLQRQVLPLCRKKHFQCVDDLCVVCKVREQLLSIVRAWYGGPYKRHGEVHHTDDTQPVVARGQRKGQDSHRNSVPIDPP